MSASQADYSTVTYLLHSVSSQAGRMQTLNLVVEGWMIDRGPVLTGRVWSIRQYLRYRTS